LLGGDADVGAVAEQFAVDEDGENVDAEVVAAAHPECVRAEPALIERAEHAEPGERLERLILLKLRQVVILLEPLDQALHDEIHSVPSWRILWPPIALSLQPPLARARTSSAVSALAGW
jgi:hypothetical protein